MPSETNIEMENLLQQHPTLIEMENNKIKCLVTGHEMPYTTKAVKQHVEGKRYKRVTKNIEKNFNYKNYEPYIKLNEKNDKLLFCILTLKKINKCPSHVLRHVNGKKFKRAKIRYDESVKNGTKFTPTPRLNNLKRKMHENEGTVVDEEENISDKEEEQDDVSDLYPEEKMTVDKPETTTKSEQKPEKRKSLDLEITKKTKRRKTTKPKQKTAKNKPTLLVYS